MKTLLCALLLGGLTVAAPTAKHKKHKKTAPAPAVSAPAEAGTKGFPPKPLPATDPRNPADPQKAPVTQK